MTGAKTAQLLRKVRSRMILCALALRAYKFFIVLAGIYAIFLSLGRLLSLFPFDFPIWAIAAPLALSLLGSLALLRPMKPQVAAALVDHRAGTKELYLTTVMLDQAIGDYKPLVLARAEEKASEIQPQKIAPFTWRKRAAILVMVMGFLAVGTAFMPRLDPFGKEAVRDELANQRQELETSKQSMAKRAEALKQQQVDSELSKEASAKLDELEKALAQLQPKETKLNEDTLKEQQKRLAEMWRKSQEKQLAEALQKNPPTQQFGALPKQAEEWKSELEQGKTDALRKEMKDMAGLAKKLAEEKDEVKKEQMRQEMRARMKGMNDFLARAANSKPLMTAMNKAMDQLALGQNAQLDADAMQALQEALNLTELELEAMAQNLRDMQAMEEALKAVQLAKQANRAGLLPGECNCKGIGEYAALYAQCMGKGKGKGEGLGMGGEGKGTGNVAPEDPTAQTDFKTELSKSTLVAGEILMEWKTQELTETGQMNPDYVRNLSEVKQGVSEAIIAEDIPPGYHDAISKYFDNLGGTTNEGK